MTTEMTDAEVMKELGNAKSPLNMARQQFSFASARLEQRSAQRLDSIMDVRRAEFKAVKQIVAAFTTGLGRWRHKKRRSLYKVLTFDGKVQCSEPIREGDQVTIYLGDDGQHWVRPVYEFTDGRFERLD